MSRSGSRQRRKREENNTSKVKAFNNFDQFLTIRTTQWNLESKSSHPQLIITEALERLEGGLKIMPLPDKVRGKGQREEAVELMERIPKTEEEM